MSQSADPTLEHAYEQARLMAEHMEILVRPFIDLADNLSQTLSTLPKPASGSVSAFQDDEAPRGPEEAHSLSKALLEVSQATGRDLFQLDMMTRIRIEPEGHEIHDGYYLEILLPHEERLVFVWDIDAQTLHHIESRQDSPVSKAVDVRAVADAVRTLLPGRD